MPESSQEISDKEIYDLYPPVADWVVEAVPAKSGPGEASPLLHSPALATTTIREALVHMESGFVHDENGEVISYDSSKISEENLAVVEEGAAAIRDNAQLPKGIREPAIGILQAIKETRNGGSEKHQAVEILDPEPKSKRIIKREARQQQELEIQREHEEERAAELSSLKEWQQKHPPAGSNYFLTAQSFIQTRAANSKRVIIVNDEGLDDYNKAYIKRLIDNPSLLMREIQDSDLLHEFRAETEAPIIDALLKHTIAKSNKLWAEQYYKNPDEIKEAYQKWLDLFGNLSEEFWMLLEYGEGFRHEVTAEHPILNQESYTRNYGIDILSKSFVELAEREPENFIDIIHELASNTLDTQDHHLIQNFFYIIGVAASSSALVKLIMTNSPIATGLSNEVRLKSVDLKLAMFQIIQRDEDEVHYYEERDKKIPKKLRKIYDRHEKAALENGLPVGHPSYAEILSQKTYAPLVQLIKAGELPNSLYLRLKQRKKLPQDA